MMAFYDELKALCAKYDCYAAVYVKPKNEKSEIKVMCVTDTDEPTKKDVAMTLEAVTYFIKAFYIMAKDKLYATHVILEIWSMVIQSFRKE